MAAEEISDWLHGLPPAEFTRARDKAARELRTEGRREEAEQVKALRKPTAAAAAVNRLVRTHRAQVEAFLRAAATLRDAQVAGKGDLATATLAERTALDKLVSLGGDVVRPTLEAAAVDDDTTRDLLQARLQREPEPPGADGATTGRHARASDRMTRRKTLTESHSFHLRARATDVRVCLGLTRPARRRCGFVGRGRSGLRVTGRQVRSRGAR
jgi:hypothetical protein